MTLEYETNNEIHRQLRTLGYQVGTVEWDGALAAARVHADRIGLGLLTIEAAAAAVTTTRQRLANLLSAACPGPHWFVQHRDRLPPWCEACRYTAIGQRIAEAESAGTIEADGLAR